MGYDERPRSRVRSTRPVLVQGSDLGGRAGVHPAVVEPLGEHHHVGREPVAAHVGDLPGLRGVRGGERRGHRAAALGAAGVVPAVGADPEQRAVHPGPVGCLAARRRHRGRGPHSSSRVVERGGEQQPAARGRQRKTLNCVPRWARWCRRASSTLMFRWVARWALTESGSRLSCGALAPQGRGARPAGRRRGGWPSRQGRPAAARPQRHSGSRRPGTAVSGRPRADPRGSAVGTAPGRTARPGRGRRG